MTKSTTGSDAPTGIGRVGDYELLERVGRGGMAEVFRASLRRGAGFKKLVALKRVRPDLASETAFRARFLGEARTAAELCHPNIVQVHDYGEDAGTPYIVMELIDGVDLFRLVSHAQQTRTPLGIAAAMYIVAQAARGLGYAHTATREGRPLGIVHRDVSPQNILVSVLGEVKVADFGIAKATSEQAALSTHTADGTLLGKLHYMAPEQVSTGAIDARADIFALGVVLHELLTTSPLRRGANPAAILDQVRTGGFQPPSEKNPEIPAELDAIVMKALRMDRDDRYARAEDMARALSNLLVELAPTFDRDSLGALVEATRAPKIVNKSVAELMSDTSAYVIEDSPAAGEILPLFAEPASSPSMAQSFVGLASRLEPRTTAPAKGSLLAHVHVVPRPVAWAGACLAALAIGVGLRQSAQTAHASAPSHVAAPAAVKEVTIAKAAAPEHVVAPKAKVAVAKSAPTRPVTRLLDGKPVVLPWDVAPAQEAPAVARALVSYQRGRTALASDKVRDAESAFQKALAEYPGLVIAYRGLGAAYARESQNDLAVSALRTYLRAAPAAPDASSLRHAIAQIEAGEAPTSL